MKILIITNPKSGQSSLFNSLKDHLKDKNHVEIIESNDATHIRAIALNGIKEMFDIVVAAGGDGTINEVVNAISDHFDKIKLGIIPLGTGNDLARTLDIPFDPIEAFNLIDSGKTNKIDLVKLETENKTSYCINMSAGGFSGAVDEIIDENMKKTWGPLAYMMGAITAIPNLVEYKTKIISDGEEINIKEVLNIVIANGRTVAGGKQVAPFASPEDGLLDLIIVKNDSSLKLAALVGKLTLGLNYVDGDMVIHKRVKNVEIIANPGMWFNIDGELLTKAPIKFSVLPQAIEVFTGLNYLAYPADYDKVVNTL